MGSKMLVAPAEVRVKTDTDDGRKGVVEAIVSVFNNVDRVGDRVIPGAFKAFVDRVNDGWKAPFVWSHQTHTPDMFIGDTLAAEETDEGLKITAQMHMDEPVAAKVFSLIEKKQVANYSFAYKVEEARWVDEDDEQVYELVKLDVSETGPCMYGANPETRTVAAKADETTSEDRAETSSQSEDLDGKDGDTQTIPLETVAEIRDLAARALTLEVTP